MMFTTNASIISIIMILYPSYHYMVFCMHWNLYCEFHAAMMNQIFLKLFILISNDRIINCSLLYIVQAMNKLCDAFNEMKCIDAIIAKIILTFFIIHSVNRRYFKCWFNIQHESIYYIIVTSIGCHTKVKFTIENWNVQIDLMHRIIPPFQCSLIIE